MAEKTVKLLSTKGRAQLIERFYFYDGEVPIKDGVVEIPVDRPEWVQRAFIMGYRFDPTTEEVLTLDEALSGQGKTPFVPVEKTESAKSAGAKKNEGTNTRRQPARSNGVRKGQPTSRKSVPKP